MSKAIQIVTTFPTHAAAETAAVELVDRKLVACVQISGPITSVYRWEGVIEHDEEYTLTLKTRRELFDAVAAAIRELHTFDIPEILAFDVVAGNEAYLKWLAEETKPQS